MNVHLENKVSGKLDWLRIIRKGKIIEFPELDNTPNLLFNSALSGFAHLAPLTGTAQSYASTIDSFEDLGGTWNQTGNTVTRSTGTATFPASPLHVGCELKWNTGERCHVTARASDTSITVSGPARTITGGTIRRYLCNDGAYWGSSIQNSSGGTTGATTLDHVAGYVEYQRTYNFPSATSAYTLGSLILEGGRVKLPSTVSIDIDDQIQCSYSRRETVSGRNQSYDLGAESIGLPQKFAMTSIVGSGTNVDVTFSAATNFLAGDKLDLRGVVPKRFALASASSTSTTFTINTSLAHGLIVGDSVVTENASLAGYNGTFTVATVPTTTSLTITNAANPGAMGASGTIRLATPGTYFNGISGGLATIASMVSSTVARITSAVTGPAVDPVNIGGDPGVIVRWRRSDTTYWKVATTANGNALFVAANAKALIDDSASSATGFPDSSGGVGFSTYSATAATYTNDWTVSALSTLNAGAGSAYVRIKQFALNWNVGGSFVQITMNQPFDKSTAQRLKVTVSKQLLRDLP